MRIGRGIERALSAAAFAEAGEPETALRLLAREGVVVLAAHGERLDAQVLACAANLCERVGASLDVVLVAAPPVRPAALAQFFGDLDRRDIPWRLAERSGALGPAVLTHVRETRHVRFVVIAAHECWGEDLTGKVSDPWSRLGCPLVVASRQSK